MTSALAYTAALIELCTRLWLEFEELADFLDADGSAIAASEAGPRLEPSDLVLVPVFGGGYSMGAALFRWNGPVANAA